MCCKEINARCAHCILQVKYVLFCLLLHQSVKVREVAKLRTLLSAPYGKNFLRSIITTKKVIFGVAQRNNY